MRTLALILLLCCVPACSTTWKGAGSGITPEQKQRGIKDVYALSTAYETQAYFSDLRRRQMGRANAFGRDLRSIGVTFDRHFFNYSPNDPYVNYETDTGYLDHLMRFAISTVAR